LIFMQTQPAENIDAVLGRFQAWAGSRNAVEAQAGVRELSCEEALRSGRYRWKVADKAPAKNKLGSEPGVTPVVSPTPALDSGPKRGKIMAAQAGDANHRGAKKARMRNQAGKAAPEPEGTARVRRERSSKTLPSAKGEVTTSFGEILAEKVQPVELIVAQPVELARQVAISIRLAPAERALIRTRAAEAGISASAYIRQCALEVEQLRAQVREALAAIECKTPVPVQPPATNHGPTLGFFARLAQKILPARGAALAVRV
jgi:hypothetical protein